MHMKQQFAGACGGGQCAFRGRSSMVERQLPKLHTRVRFPSPAPVYFCKRIQPVTPFCRWIHVPHVFPTGFPVICSRRVLVPVRPDAIVQPRVTCHGSADVAARCLCSVVSGRGADHVEGRTRENRPYGSEGGEGETPFPTPILLGGRGAPFVEMAGTSSAMTLGDRHELCPVTQTMALRVSGCRYGCSPGSNRTGIVKPYLGRTSPNAFRMAGRRPCPH